MFKKIAILALLIVFTIIIITPGCGEDKASSGFTITAPEDKDETTYDTGGGTTRFGPLQFTLLDSSGVSKNDVDIEVYAYNGGSIVDKDGNCIDPDSCWYLKTETDNNGVIEFWYEFSYPACNADEDRSYTYSAGVVAASASAGWTVTFTVSQCPS